MAACPACGKDVPLSDLGEVLLAAGQQAEGVALLGQALDRSERKRHLVRAERMRSRLVELGSSTVSSS